MIADWWQLGKLCDVFYYCDILYLLWSKFHVRHIGFVKTIKCVVGNSRLNSPASWWMSDCVSLGRCMLTCRTQTWLSLRLSACIWSTGSRAAFQMTGPALLLSPSVHGDSAKKHPLNYTLHLAWNHTGKPEQTRPAAAIKHPLLYHTWLSTQDAKSNLAVTPWNVKSTLSRNKR